MPTTSATGLRPLIQIADVVGTDKLYNPRQPYERRGISADDDAACDGLTGANTLVAAGPLRVLCHRDAATVAAVELLALAGHALEADPVAYESREDYAGQLARAADGEVVYQHVHPRSSARPETYLVDRELLLRLTNKGRLHEVVDPQHLPRRRLVAPERLTSSVSNGELPVVVKAACDESLGGGDGVRICRSPGDVARAGGDFGPAGEVVVEELLAVASNWCVNFAIVPGEPVRYLGAAEQIVSPEGEYRGSRIALGRSPARELAELGQEIAQTARDLGYRGVAGFDIVQTAEGRTVALDLNFRLNSCTTALLLRDSLLEWSGRRYLVAYDWRTRLDDLRLHRTVSALVDRRRFVPTGCFLPEAGERRVWGVVLGDGWRDAHALVAVVRAALGG
jgi:hypothetical protein